MSALLIVSELGMAKVIAAKNPPPGALKLQDWLMQGWNADDCADRSDGEAKDQVGTHDFTSGHAPRPSRRTILARLWL
jgi:hypothetical protein